MRRIGVDVNAPRHLVEVTAVFGDDPNPEGDWIVWARLLAPSFEIAELRVVPANTDGGFVNAYDPENHPLRLDHVPEGGLSFRRLHNEVSSRQLVAWAREGWADAGMSGASSSWAALVGRPTVRKPQSTDERLAVLAREYVELIETGEDRPAEVLAERYGRTAGWVSTEIYRARTRRLGDGQRGLLTRAPKQGRPGGSLTPEAREILERLEGGDDDG